MFRNLFSSVSQISQWSKSHLLTHVRSLFTVCVELVWTEQSDVWTSNFGFYSGFSFSFHLGPSADCRCLAVNERWDKIWNLSMEAASLFSCGLCCLWHPTALSLLRPHGKKKKGLKISSELCHRVSAFWDKMFCCVYCVPFWKSFCLAFLITILLCCNASCEHFTLKHEINL